MEHSTNYLQVEIRNTLVTVMGSNRKNARTLYYLVIMRTFLTNFLSLFYIVYFITSVLGNVVSPYFFAFHLFQTIISSNQLKTVMKALRLSFGTLCVLGLFILVVIYFFSIISLLYFSHHYNPETGQYCDTLIQCIASNLYFGYNSKIYRFFPNE